MINFLQVYVCYNCEVLFTEFDKSRSPIPKASAF